MRQLFLFMTLLLGNFYFCMGQGLSRFEVWGWEGSKQEFAKMYQEKTGVDLSKGHACAAELRKMGYKYALSQGFLNPDHQPGEKFDWSKMENIAVVRQVQENKYTKLAVDSAWMDSTNNLLAKLSKMDSIAVNQFWAENKSQRRDILTGTLSETGMVGTPQSDCLNLLYYLSKIDYKNYKASREEKKILSTMLSYPAPDVCRCAMKIIAESDNYSKKLIRQEGALTLRDCLQSKLQHFKSDAMTFLAKTKPKGSQWTSQEWLKWLNKQTKISQKIRIFRDNNLSKM